MTKRITAMDCEAACDKVRAIPNYLNWDDATLLGMAWKGLLDNLGLRHNEEYELHPQHPQSYQGNEDPESASMLVEIDKNLAVYSDENSRCRESFRKLIDRASEGKS